MKKLIILMFLATTMQAFGQAERFQHSISIELIPVAQMYGYSTGMNAAYNFETRRFYHSIAAGFIFSNHLSGAEIDRVKVNGQPVANWGTEIDIDSEPSYPLGGVVSDFVFYQLEDFGYHHFKPKFNFRLNRFLSYELLYKIIDSKLRLSYGIGVTAGLTIREYTVAGFNGIITNELNGFSEQFWVNVDVRAKYLYWGPTTRFNLDYKITENLRAGVSGGFQYIFDKNYSVDEGIYFLGLRFEASI